MTDPTGRHHDEVPRPAAEMDPDAPLPTDRGLHPLAELPRPYAREQLESREQAIKDGILRMGSMVAERMLAAIDALERHDAEAATAIIEGDDDINREQQRIATLIAQTIIRDQPVARDLRFLHGAGPRRLRPGAHGGPRRERGQAGPQAGARCRPWRTTSDCRTLGRAVAQQVRDILSAIVDVDAERARAVAKADDAIDDMYHRIFARAAGGACAPTRPTSTRARASSSRRTTSSAPVTASRTSPRTSSSWPPASFEELN